MLGVATLMCMSATMVVLIERKSRTAPPLATARSRSIP